MDYTRLRGVADRLLTTHGQGTIDASETTTVAGLTPIDPPTVTTTWELTHGVARGVSQKYIDNVRILTSDLMLIVQASADVQVGHMVRIDGVEKNVLQVENIPAAGVAVCKRVIVRG